MAADAQSGQVPADATMPERTVNAPAPGDPVPSHFRHCFGCGIDHPTGLHMQMEAGEGLTVIGRFTVTENHQGAPGLAHGGVLASAIDDVLGGLNWLLGEPAVTGRLTCDYKAPVPVGTTLFIRSRIDGVKGRKVYVSAIAHLGDESGPVAVTASAIFIQVPIEHFLTHGNQAQVQQAIEDRAAGRPSFRGGDHSALDRWELNP